MRATLGNYAVRMRPWLTRAAVLAVLHAAADTLIAYYRLGEPTELTRPGGDRRGRGAPRLAPPGVAGGAARSGEPPHRLLPARRPHGVARPAWCRGAGS